MQELIDKNYPKELLENREIIESQFVLSLYKNISLLDSYYNLIKIDKTIEKNSLKTDSGIFYYQIIKAMYDKGFKEVDSSTVQLFIRDKESIKKTFDTFGGIGYLFTKMLPNINEKNIETYYDNLIKSNAMINYYSIGFDIMRYYDKLKATNVSADDIIDFMTHLNEDCVVESVKNDRFIDLGIPEDFIEQCQSGQFLGLPFAKGNNILQYLTMGIPRGYLTMIGGYSGCVDCDTEFFTGTEWKKISEYQEGDMVLQYNADGTANLVKPLEYHKYPCNEMWHFKTNNLDQMLSDEHNVIYTTSKGNLFKKQMKDIVKNHKESKCGFSGKFICSYDYKQNQLNDEYKISNEDLRLAIAISAEGHFVSKHSSYCRIMLKHQYKKDMLEKLLKEANISYEKNDISHWKSKDGYHEYKFYPKYRIKEFPKEWYKLPIEQLNIIADFVPFWDGTYKAGRNKNNWVYRSSIKNNIDFIQFLWNGMNYTTNINEDRRRFDKTGKIYYEVCRSNIQNKKCSLLKKGGKTEINKEKTKDGYKYCFTVPSSMLVLRRNNKIFTTGNSGKTSFVFSEIIMGLVKNDIKCGILTNEQKARDFQILLLIYVLVNDLNYYTLIRKTFKSGNFTDEDIQKIKEAKDIINEKYSKNIRFLEANKNDVKSMCHDIRMESKKGCELFLYDTFKSSDDMSDVMWQQLLKESRMMHKLAQELDVAIVTNYQLALHTENLQRFLDAKVLSNGKQIKEVYSEMLFMRKLWNDEYTDCKFDVKPYVFARDANGKIKKEIGEDGKSKAVKEYITLDKDKRYMIFFLNKTRNNEDGICVLYEFRGNWNKWVEIGYCNVSTENRR